jgi:ribosomal protein S18 acetylase RimI-like enzyme
MISIERVTPSNVSTFKAVRLRALQDSPQAFGSTYARESAFPDSEWLQRAKRWNGETGVGFLAIDDGAPCGIAGAFLDEGDPTRARLVSMWTAPTHRRRAIGRLLVDQVLEWARLRKARMLLLMVTSMNDPAIRFYEKLGFMRNGRTERYPNDPALIEYEMSRPT